MKTKTTTPVIDFATTTESFNSRGIHVPMKTACKLLYGIVILFSTFFIMNCTDYLEDAEKYEIERKKEERSKEVRDSLTGEIIFYHGESSCIRKVSAKRGGSGISIAASGYYYYFGPKWSPDGSKIAFCKLKQTPSDSNMISNQYLVILNKRGIEENEWLLGPLSGRIRSITWCPDGQFVAVLKDHNIILYVNNTNGEITETQLISPTGGSYRTIAWWPKGNKIAIYLEYGLKTNSDGTIDTDKNSIWLFDAFDINPQKHPKNLLIKVSSSIFDDFHMNWSRDGSMLAYSLTGLFGGGSIFIVNYDGTDHREIVLKGLYKDDRINGFQPSWALNNQQIVFTSITKYGFWTNTSNTLGLFVTDIDGSYLVDLKINGSLADWY